MDTGIQWRDIWKKRLKQLSPQAILESTPEIKLPPQASSIKDKIKGVLSSLKKTSFF